MVLPQSICVPMHCDCIGFGWIIWIARKTISCHFTLIHSCNSLSLCSCAVLSNSFSIRLSLLLFLFLGFYISFACDSNIYISYLCFWMFEPFCKAFCFLFQCNVADAVRVPNRKMVCWIESEITLEYKCYFKMHMHFNQKDNLWWRCRFYTLETILHSAIVYFHGAFCHIHFHSRTLFHLSRTLVPCIFIRCIVFYRVHSWVLFVAHYNRHAIWAIAILCRGKPTTVKLFNTRYINALCKQIDECKICVAIDCIYKIVSNPT